MGLVHAIAATDWWSTIIIPGAAVLAVGVIYDLRQWLARRKGVRSTGQAGAAAKANDT